TDSNGNSLLDFLKPVSAKVTEDTRSCSQNCTNCGGCLSPVGCAAWVNEVLNFYLCNGATGNGYYCIGGGGVFQTCSANCGDFECGDALVLNAWEGIRNCTANAGFPIVQGPLPRGSVIWFGSQSQIQRCVGCVSP